MLFANAGLLPIVIPLHKARRRHCGADRRHHRYLADVCDLEPEMESSLSSCFSLSGAPKAALSADRAFRSAGPF